MTRHFTPDELIVRLTHSANPMDEQISAVEFGMLMLSLQNTSPSHPVVCVWDMFSMHLLSDWALANAEQFAAIEAELDATPSLRS